jgi:RimJ/RimL family protein N-acetyltransferase
MGYATGLVNHVVLWHARNFPCTPLVLQVSSRNEAAIRIYEKIGFRETDSIKYYSL